MAVGSAYYIRNLDEIPWDAVDQAQQNFAHPMPIRITATEIIDARNGVVCARAEPGYKFWMGHFHVHVGPDDWIAAYRGEGNQE